MLDKAVFQRCQASGSGRKYSRYGAYDPGSLCPQVETAEQSRPASSRDEEPFAGDSLMHLQVVLG